MSLKSQSMLLAFGDNSSSNIGNLQTLQVDHATKVDLETSCNTAATTATKLYPQLLLRIGQADIEAETETATATATETEAGVEAAAASTIISCNVAAADVRNVLPAGEIAESNNGNDNASQLMLVDWTTATSALTNAQHTVKIQIANGQSAPTAAATATVAGATAAATVADQRKLGKQISVVKLNDSQSNSEMLLQLKQQQLLQVQQQQQQQQQQQPYQLCYLVSSGQYSPCETLDSGTGSDLESIKSPDSNSCSSKSNSCNLSGSNNNSATPQLQLHLKTTRIRVNNSSAPSGMPHVQRAYSLTDDSEECDESSSSLSCDSLHSNEAAPPHKLGSLLPSSLLHDIRNREGDGEGEGQRELQHVMTATKIDGRPLQFEADQFYNFHVNEHDNYRSFGQLYDYTTHSLQSGNQQQLLQPEGEEEEQEDAFVGYKDVRRASQASTIRSSKGTVRGVKNRVRNGVATFLQLQQPNAKNYKEKDVGKVVLYTTSMGIIRDTYGKCANVKQILRTLLIKFEERDVFMSLEYQQEMRDRMQHETIRVPQLFVEGQHIGDADTVERLNESGELRQLLRPYKSIATAYTCQMCGGYRLLPCPSCNGSKKSVHRNHFTTEFVALKCMNCDEVGLVKCPNC
ncbi:glutaredoxin domain-containing cysteine-rich protein CG12206 [Drosophila innubila]|uniref:glutaredoxin domain-containing cysteine-rich protein CG12206 n=1 Tax=Drosophila innubila TaxID=198719 RepID=UPI00148E12E0|nr:glutaredoxin domain-containing cysteine-rich protein CG12206 [Drosophila innubila]